MVQTAKMPPRRTDFNDPDAVSDLINRVGREPIKMVYVKEGAPADVLSYPVRPRSAFRRAARRLRYYFLNATRR